MTGGFSIYRNFYIKITILMLASILVFPAVENLSAGIAAITLLDVALMLMAIHLVSTGSTRRRWRRVPLVLLGMVAIGLDLYSVFVPNRHFLLAATLFFCGFYLFAIYNMLKYVLSPGRITLDRIFASLTAYMTMALFWALIYRALYLVEPHSFRFDTTIQRAEVPFYDFLYFSYATITTTGYGDIVPNTHQVQSFAIVEQMVGVLYVAILVARLTNLYAPTPPRRLGRAPTAPAQRPRPVHGAADPTSPDCQAPADGVGEASTTRHP
ncbi:potassium channel family protein [Aquabacter sediminis]|uniref:potassium channel family protein n=1 Tax=Aquabacter sediminis TaxID=3029197 RepID=UPI00237DCE7E|nr:potassium channel family protein [Aquabacter sp. P-9]MDE1568233.1 ion channel [Aquabacter sp. P-9]